LLDKLNDLSSESTSTKKCEKIGSDPINFCLWMKSLPNKIKKNKNVFFG